MATAKTTTNHDEIRKWVEARKGRPARVKATGRGKDPGILRIDFPGFSGEDTLEEIEWDEFFEWFDKNNLALLLSGERGNRFNKLVQRSESSSGRGAKSSSKKSSSGRGAKSSSKKSSSKQASGSAKKASGSTKKASGTKSAASAKKASSSTKKASTSAKKSSSSTKKASTSTKKAATSTKKAAPAKKSAAKKSTSSKKSTSTSTTRRLVASKTPSRKSGSSKKSSSSKKSTGASSKTTTNRDEIRNWVESRGGFPATVAGTEGRGEDAGLLRIDYPGFSGAGTLERIDWDTWFDKFDEEKLAFLYQDKKNSRFSKLVRR